MRTTRASLLVRIKDPNAAEAWSEFHELYAPLIYGYARRRGLNRDEADDVRSECYKAIVQQIRTFDYDHAKGGFKAWLRTMVDRRVIDLFRKKRERQANTGDFQQLEAGHPSPAEVWELEWKNQHLKHCVELLRSEVSQTTFQIFSMVVVQGRPVAEACDELGLSANQVYKARARMLRRVREKLAEFGCENIAGV